MVLGNKAERTKRMKAKLINKWNFVHLNGHHKDSKPETYTQNEAL